MSIIDKVVAAVTPPESEQARAEARSKARAAAKSGDWLSLILEHHVQIENAFAAVKAAKASGTRRLAEKRLGLLLTGHANAEESVVYPALALHDEKGHASSGYTEQAAVKIQMAALENLDPMSQDYLDKLEHIRGAVAHHVYEEEGNWLPELTEKLSPTDAAQITKRYKEEFDRYLGEDAAA
jgi:hypothetical protein